MIYEKSLETPAFRTRRVRRKLSLFQEEDGALTAFALHFKREGERLVCAEGTEILSSLPEGAEVLIAAEGHGNGLYVYGDGALFSVEEGVSYALGEPPCAVLKFLDKDGENVSVFAVTESAVYALSGGETAAVNAEGGTCAAVHYERIFLGQGCRVRYSQPLCPAGWVQAVQDAGYVDLPSYGGDILAIVPYKEKLYLFRERGITQLRALGDTLNFKAAAMPYACGEILKGTVKNCGGRVLFLTRSGLYSFNGATCSRLDGYGSSSIDRDQNISCAVYDGNYFCAVTAKGGERCIFCADPEGKTGHIIRAAAESVAGGERLFFMEDGNLCRLTERGVCKGGLLLRTERSLLGLSNGKKFLDSVTAEGEGYFDVTVISGSAASSARGWGGEELKFSTPVRGNAFSIEIRSYSENACLGAVTLSLREEKS